MPVTNTTPVDFERLNYRAESASVIIRLMMACNDIVLANQGLAKSKEEYVGIRNHIQRGVGMYFVRLQCGHLNEALKLIEEIKNDPDLFNSVKCCRQIAQEAFSKLEKCLEGGSDCDQFRTYVRLVRNKIGFHYDKAFVDAALSSRANRPESRKSTITRGDHINLWRCTAADDIVDTIACREIWNIPLDADVRAEANRCAEFGSDLCKAFVEFCSEFIWQYIRQ